MERSIVMHDQEGINPMRIDQYCNRAIGIYENRIGRLQERFKAMRFDDEDEDLYYGENDTEYSVEATFRIGTEDDEPDMEKVHTTLSKINSAEELKAIFAKSFDTENDRYEVYKHLGDDEFPEYHLTFYIERLFANLLLCKYFDDGEQTPLSKYETIKIKMFYFLIHLVMIKRSQNRITEENFNLSMTNLVSSIFNLSNNRIIYEIADKGYLPVVVEAIKNENFSERFYEYTLHMFEKLYKCKGISSLNYHYILIFGDFIFTCFNTKRFYEIQRAGELPHLFEVVEYVNRYRNVMTNSINRDNYHILYEMILDKFRRKVLPEDCYTSLLPISLVNLHFILRTYELDYTYFQTYLRVVEHKTIQFTSLTNDILMEE